MVTGLDTCYICSCGYRTGYMLYMYLWLPGWMHAIYVPVITGLDAFCRIKGYRQDICYTEVVVTWIYSVYKGDGYQAGCILDNGNGYQARYMLYMYLCLPCWIHATYVLWSPCRIHDIYVQYL